LKGHGSQTNLTSRAEGAKTACSGGCVVFGDELRNELSGNFTISSTGASHSAAVTNGQADRRQDIALTYCRHWYVWIINLLRLCENEVFIRGFI
jgi:hypothetical protein